MLAELSQQTNQTLLLELKTLVKKEREILGQILELLKEVDRRKLYLDLAYPSLFEFCVDHLGYSESAAYRRIQAMRLVRELPELKTKIEEGKLNISNLSQAQSFFVSEVKKQNKIYTREEKRQILLKLENKTKLETEKELVKISPESAKGADEFISFITPEKIRLKTTINPTLFKKLKKLKSLLSHKNPNYSYAELIEELADRALNNLGKDDSLPENSSSRQDLDHGIAAASETEEEFLMIKMGIPRNRHIPEKLKREVWQRDGGKCSYKDAASGKICGSEHLLQIDHIIPFSEGGLSKDAKNLRLLCAQHNRARHPNSLPLRRNGAQQTRDLKNSS